MYLRRFCRNLSLILVILASAWFLLPGLARACSDTAIAWTVKNPRLLIDLALPAWGHGCPKPLDMAYSVLKTASGVDLSGPRAIVLSQLPIDTDQDRVIHVDPHPADSPPQAEPVEVVPGYKPTVAIYNTHTGESFPLSDGVERRDGVPGSVVDVAARLENRLKASGVLTIRSAKIHDMPYERSYLASLETAKSLLEQHPEIDALLDIHRDSQRARERAMKTINNKKAATILLVVGSDARQPFPHWRENYAFAQALFRKGEEMYPGLIDDVRVKEGRYNQYLHPRAVVVEIGGVSNYRAEALYSAELFADVLAAVLSEIGDYRAYSDMDENGGAVSNAGNKTLPVMDDPLVRRNNLGNAGLRQQPQPGGGTECSGETGSVGACGQSDVSAATPQ